MSIFEQQIEKNNIEIRYLNLCIIETKFRMGEVAARSNTSEMGYHAMQLALYEKFRKTLDSNNAVLKQAK